jgi:hypothetical protein
LVRSRALSTAVVGAFAVRPGREHARIRSAAAIVAFLLALPVAASAHHGGGGLRPGARCSPRHHAIYAAHGLVCGADDRLHHAG